MIKSASSASAFAGSQPVTPTGPHQEGSVARSDDLPATVSTTGISKVAAKSDNSLCALLYRTPPPAIIKGFLAFLISSTAVAREFKSTLGLLIS